MRQLRGRATPHPGITFGSVVSERAEPPEVPIAGGVVTRQVQRTCPKIPGKQDATVEPDPHLRYPSMNSGEQGTPQINPAWLKPFASFLVLECTSSLPKEATSQLLTHVGEAISRKRGDVLVVASGVEAAEGLLREDGDGTGFDEVDGALFRPSC